MPTPREEIDRLADYLMGAWHKEIGQGDPVHGESAVDVAIRLLKRLEAYDAQPAQPSNQASPEECKE